MLRSHLFVLGLVAIASAQPDVDARVAELLSGMSLKDKIGQMTQLDLSTLLAVEGAPGREPVIDPAKVAEVIGRRGVGSILNASQIAHTPEKWREILEAIQAAALARPQKIPVLYALDSVHGANYVRGATLFPQALNLAATFDADLAARIAKVTARDTRAIGVPWNFAPVVDVARTPLWSRFFETFGEDVLLARRLGAAQIKAMQGDRLSAPDAVAGCLKHFVGYSAPRTGRDRTPAWIPERQLREIFLPPFAAGVAAGAATVMVNSGDIAGIPTHADKDLLEGVLRGELGFQGVIVTDWQDIQKLVEIHRVAADDGEAVRQAIGAGIDMAMVPLDFRFSDALEREVLAGRIAVERIDASVQRILKLKVQLGLFEAPLPDPSLAKAIGSAADRELSAEAATASLVLLRNEVPAGANAPLLPFAAPKKLVVLGPAAEDIPVLHGGWTWTWQGADALAYPEGVPTIAKGLRQRFGADRVHVASGLAAIGEPNVRDADAILVVVGERPSVEKPGDIPSLDVPLEDRARIEDALSTGRPVVVLTVTARPLVFHGLLQRVTAHLHVGLPGPEGARAIAAILAGDATPTGRLPFTWPRSTGALLTDDHVTTERLDPRFGMSAFDPEYAFGSGLSTTRFAYENLKLVKAELAVDQALEFEVTIANAGERPGTETVLAFVRDEVASITPAHRRLRDYQRVQLQPGERKTLRFQIPLQELAFVGKDQHFVLEPGAFTLMVGPLAARFDVKAPR